jgi:outer membrane lipoprotein-sorting protein
MKRLLPLGWVLFTALCLLPNVPGPAGAFVLEGPQVLELMARQQEKLKGLRVAQTLVVHGGSPEGPSAEFAETIIYRFPDRFRSELAGQGRQRLHVFLSTGGVLCKKPSSLGKGGWHRRRSAHCWKAAGF